MSMRPPDKEWVAVGLVRTSTIMQVETGLSMITQPERIREFAARNGLTLSHLYEEPGISGRKAQRNTVDRILRDARAGRFNLLVVTDVSRFFRNLEALISAIKTLKACGVDFLSIDDGIDTRRQDSWGNELVMVILGMLAELYAVQLAHNTREGKYRRFKLGLWNGSIPFGYCNGLCSNCTHPNGSDYCPNFGRPDLGNGADLILHPIESDGVRLAFETYATGDFSDHDTAEMLAQHEVAVADGSVRRLRVPCKRPPKEEIPLPAQSPRPPHGYRPPYKDFVRYLLQRPFYAGSVTYTHEPGPKQPHTPIWVEENTGTHPAIISRELFEQVQRLRSSIGTNSRRQGESRRIYPLSGLLRCGRCGGPMRGTSANGGVRYYQCSQRAERHRLTNGQECEQPLVQADYVEDEVVALLQRLAVPAQLRPDILAHCFYQDDVEVIDYRRRKLINSMQRYTQLYEVGTIAWEEFQTRLTGLRKAIAELTPDQQANAPQAESLLGSIATLWAAATDVERRLLSLLVFRYLVVKDQGLTGYAFRRFIAPARTEEEPR